MVKQALVRCWFPVLAAVLAVSCSGPGSNRDEAPDDSPDLANLADAVPREEPVSRYGNPQSYEVFGKRYQTMDTSADYREKGIASWYGTKFHGRATSSGEPYDMYAMTAAHKSLPIPTYVRVTEKRSNKSVVVRVNDRGPFHEGRVIDLSYAAATKLGIHKAGTAEVEVVALAPYQSRNGHSTKQAPQRIVAKRPIAAIPAGNVYLQMGAFSDRDNAERLLRQLDTLIPGRVRVDIQAEGAPLYRVRVGPLADQEMVALQTQLADNGYPDSHVVID